MYINFNLIIADKLLENFSIYECFYFFKITLLKLICIYTSPKLIFQMNCQPSYDDKSFIV